MAKSTTAVATREKKEVAAAIDNDVASLLFQNAGLGMETVTADDVSIPRFKLLQDLSPEVNKRKAEYVEGAEPGDFYNTATKEVSKTLHVLPVVYRRHNIEWKPDRGGFVADHGDDETLVRVARTDDKYNLILPNGNLIVPTGTWYVTDLASGQNGIISMSRTQFNPSKDWLNLTKSERVPRPDGLGVYNPPLCYRSYKLTGRVRDKGENSWYVWNAERAETVLELQKSLGIPDLFAQAIAFAGLITSGEIKAGADAFTDDAGSNHHDDNDTM